MFKSLPFFNNSVGNLLENIAIKYHIKLSKRDALSLTETLRDISCQRRNAFAVEDIGNSISISFDRDKDIIESFLFSFKDLGFTDRELKCSAFIRILFTIEFSNVFSMKQGKELLHKMYKEGTNLNYFSFTPAGHVEVQNSVETRTLGGIFPLVTPEIYNPILAAFFADYELDAVTREKFLDAYLHLENQNA